MTIAELRPLLRAHGCTFEEGRKHTMFQLGARSAIVVTFPDVGYGATQGATEAEALEMADDFLAMAIGDLMKQGKDLPPARARRGRKYRWIGLPALASANVELYRELKASGMRKAELARRLKISRGNIDRLFDLQHSSRLEHLEAAFAALGRRLMIGVEKAA